MNIWYSSSKVAKGLHSWAKMIFTLPPAKLLSCKVTNLRQILAKTERLLLVFDNNWLY